MHKEVQLLCKTINNVVAEERAVIFIDQHLRMTSIANGCDI